MSASAAADPGGPAGSSRLRRSLLRFAVLTLIVGALAALLLLTPAAEYLDREKLTALLGRLRQAWWAPLVLIASYSVVAPSGIPVTPLVIAGALVFGPLWGWGYNTVGCLLGAVISFGLARALGKELVEHLAGEARMRRVEAMLERHGFWTLVGIRFVPIPFALINYSSALAGFRFTAFLSASIIGLAPSVLMWTYLYHALVSAATEERGALLRNFGLILVLIALLLLLRPLGRYLLKRDRATDGDPEAS
ncbi:MAG: TVP38/TMEM64 family protein [Thermoanaerobaculia bacterium]